MTLNQRAIQSEHFTLQQLGDGLYAAIATEMGAAFSNAGLVDLGDRTLVFDAFDSPQAAEDLLKACLQLTGRSPSAVIISHWHPDHWGGLQVFTGAEILSTPESRKAMIPVTKDMVEERENPTYWQAELDKTRAQLVGETDANIRHTLQVSISRLPHTLQALPTLEPTLPNQAFKGKIVFHGTLRSAELIAMGKGHTLSDCILRLPQERVAFIGDLGFFQSQPFMPYGYPQKWVALLKDMVTWDIDTFVPGHGPVGDKTDLTFVAEYILALEALVAQVVLAGGSVEDALQQILPAPFNAWQVTGHRFEANVRASFRKQSAARRKKRADPVN